MDRLPLPSEMMRANRPHLYSDSTRTDAYRLSESELRQHLASLTSRNQHKDFENFCRKLCEKELCPNLRPQTGPEGGGDGKVDTETYPVDDEISERWYVGNGASGREAWGFAFSAKKTWATKVRLDVAGLVATGRHYDRIIFITSRAARQLNRLNVEAELNAEFQIPVTILDQEWIVERVFENDHKDLAFEFLRAGAHEPDKVKLGPNDFARRQALDEIEKQIVAMGSDIRDHTQAVSDALEAAKLSRMLELPRVETDGRFQRAIRFARKHGADYQLIHAIYEHAWTAVWWFDDIQAMSELYEELENLAYSSGQAVHIGKVCNLHQVLASRVAQGLETADELSISDRTERLIAKLSDLTAEDNRPNNALYAETLLTLQQLQAEMAKIGDGIANFDSIWESLIDIIRRAEGLGEFPAELIDSVLPVLAENVPESEVFDELVENLAEFMGARSRDVKAAALFYLSVGYKAAGLLWAARATALSSVIQYLALSEIDNEHRIEMIPALNLLAEVSLRVGHVLDAIAAHHFVQSMASALPLDEDTIERVKNEHVDFDRRLAMLLVIQSGEQLSRLDRLPDVLDALQLFTAKFVLLYRLGHVAELREDNSIPWDMSDDDLCTTIETIAQRAHQSRLPSTLTLCDGLFPVLRTKILGVNVTIESDPNQNGYLLSQTYATSLESFAATLLNAGAYAQTADLSVRVARIAGERTNISFADSVLTVETPEGWLLQNISTIEKLNRHLIETSVIALTNIAILRDPMATMTELFETERVFERATMFAHSGISRTRVFGTTVGRVEDWDFLIKRAYPLQADAPPTPNTTSNDDSEAKPHDSEFTAPESELRRHDDIDVLTVINSNLWNDAEWLGVTYRCEEFGQPPILGLIFRNFDRGALIFSEWLNRLGHDDSMEAIRVSFIKGIARHSPLRYRAHITANIHTSTTRKGRKYVSMSRMQTMDPSHHEHLDQFLTYLGAAGSYILLPTCLSDSVTGKLRLDLGIRKSALHIMEAWNIGPHDIDAVAIRAEDDVDIPGGVTDPPFDKLKAWRAKHGITRPSE